MHRYDADDDHDDDDDDALLRHLPRLKWLKHLN